jgi:hypothetical protein
VHSRGRVSLLLRVLPANETYVCVCVFISCARNNLHQSVSFGFKERCLAPEGVLFRAERAGRDVASHSQPARFQVLNDRYETLVGTVTAVRLSRTDTTHDLSREAEKRCQESVACNEIDRS